MSNESPPDLFAAILALRPRTLRDAQREEDGRLAILVPRFGGWIGRILQPRLRRPFFQVRLDALGSFVWARCDGTRDGEAIARDLAEAFPGETDPRGRVALFLRHLAMQGHLVLDGVEGGGGGL